MLGPFLLFDRAAGFLLPRPPPRRCFTLTGGNRNDVTQLVPLIEPIPVVLGRVGGPRRLPERRTVDRGYRAGTTAQKTLELIVIRVVSAGGPQLVARALALLEQQYIAIAWRTRRVAGGV